MAAPASGFRRFLFRLTDREPVVVFSGAVGLLGISMPLFVPSIRASMGLDTTQYYGRQEKQSLFGGESAVPAEVASEPPRFVRNVGSMPTALE